MLLENLGCEVRFWITSQYGSVICECGDDGVMSGGDIGCEKEVQLGAQYGTLGDSGETVGEGQNCSRCGSETQNIHMSEVGERKKEIKSNID